MKLTKSRAQELVDKYLIEMRTWLHLKKSLIINVHVLNSKSKKLLKEKGVTPGAEVGCTWASVSSNAADIILYYDRHEDEKEFVGTLIHELLHVKFAPLSGCVTIAGSKANRIEEHIVIDFEHILADVLFEKERLIKQLRRLKNE